MTLQSAQLSHATVLSQGTLLANSTPVFSHLSGAASVASVAVVGVGVRRRWRSRPAWSYCAKDEVGGRVRVRRARWKERRGWKRRGEGCVGALRMLVSGGLRQMSVPGGAVRVVVVDMFGFLERWDGVDEKLLIGTKVVE